MINLENHLSGSITSCFCETHILVCFSFGLARTNMVEIWEVRKQSTFTAFTCRQANVLSTVFFFMLFLFLHPHYSLRVDSWRMKVLYYFFCVPSICIVLLYLVVVYCELSRLAEHPPYPCLMLVRAACVRCHGTKCPLLTAYFAKLSTTRLALAWLRLVLFPINPATHPHPPTPKK